MGIHAILKRLGLSKSDNAPATTLDHMTATLHTSLVSIMKDGDADLQPDLIDETLEQFREVLLEEQEAGTLLQKADKPSRTPDPKDADEDADNDDGDDEGDDDSTTTSEDEDMDKEVKKAYEDRIAALEAQLAESDVAKADVQKLHDRVAKFEEAEAERTSLAKAREVLGEMASQDEVTKVAEQIRKGFDVEVLATIAKQRDTFAKAAQLTVAVGSEGSDATSPVAQLAKAASEIMSKDSTLTREQAIAKAVDNNPALYDAQLATA